MNGRGKKQGGASGGGRGSARARKPEDPTAALGAKLAKVLDRIPETQAEVLRYRMGLVDGQPHSTADTARALGLSLSEAREIEERAFSHIREAVPVEHLQRFLSDGGR